MRRQECSVILKLFLITSQLGINFKFHQHTYLTGWRTPGQTGLNYQNYYINYNLMPVMSSRDSHWPEQSNYWTNYLHDQVICVV